MNNILVFLSITFMVVALYNATFWSLRFLAHHLPKIQAYFISGWAEEYMQNTGDYVPKNIVFWFVAVFAELVAGKNGLLETVRLYAIILQIILESFSAILSGIATLMSDDFISSLSKNIIRARSRIIDGTIQEIETKYENRLSSTLKKKNKAVKGVFSEWQNAEQASVYFVSAIKHGAQFNMSASQVLQQLDKRVVERYSDPKSRMSVINKTRDATMKNLSE